MPDKTPNHTFSASWAFFFKGSLLMLYARQLSGSLEIPVSQRTVSLFFFSRMKVDLGLTSIDMLWKKKKKYCIENDPA